MDSPAAPGPHSGSGLGFESDAGPGTRLLVLGEYWHPDRAERTELGLLVHRAKDLAAEAAARQLAQRFAALATRLGDTADGSARLVVPVPPTAPSPPTAPTPLQPSKPLEPSPAAESERPHLATRLAAALAAAGAGECRPSLVTRTNDTPRLRHTDPHRRAEVAAAAGYTAHGSAAGRHIVVVDDVILTGATVRAVAACLRDAGAASVTAAVAARTRQR